MSAMVVFVTASNSREAKTLTRHLVGEKLAACVSVVPRIQSTYWWKGKIEQGREILLIIKTERKKLNVLVRRIRTLHSYAVPEVLALPVVAGNAAYLKWIKASVAGETRKSSND